MVLTKMKETAEAYLGHDVKDAVVTVPAVSFNLFFRRVEFRQKAWSSIKKYICCNACVATFFSFQFC